MEATEETTTMDLTEEWRPSHNPWIIAVSVMLATFMEVLDTTIVNVALPHIAGTLSATTYEATWVLTSYLVSNAIILPATGWLGKFFGRKRFLIFCTAIFTISSALCGAAASLGMLIAARVIQGAGGGALLPISQAILLESFPPHRRGAAMSIFGLGVIVAPVIGPVLGGWLTDNYSWRWVFYINLPIGILAVLMARAFIEDPPYARKALRSTIDSIGFGLMAVGIGTLQVILDKGQQEDWFESAWISRLALISAISLTAFIVWELRQKEPIVNLRILADRNFALGTLLMTLLGVILYGTLVMVPLFLQTLMGYPALQSGFVLSPGGLGSMIALVLVGRLVSMIDNRILILFGFGLLAYSILLLGNINLEIARGDLVWRVILMGVSSGFIFVPLTIVTMGMLQQQQMSNAAGIFNLMRNIGGSMGVAVVTTLLSRGAQTHQALMVPHLTTYNFGFQQRLQQLQAGLSSQVGATTAGQHAYGIIYGILIQQATLCAFVDNFRLLALLCLLCAPLILLFKKVRARGGPMAVH